METAMDKMIDEKKYARQITYMGAGCGLVLFGIFGLLPGSFLGGVMGLNLVGILLGVPVVSGVLARIIVASFMIIGIMVSGIMFIMAASTAGWLFGSVIDTLRVQKNNIMTAKQNKLHKEEKKEE
jgi:hypothetical protein